MIVRERAQRALDLVEWLDWRIAQRVDYQLEQRLTLKERGIALNGCCIKIIAGYKYDYKVSGWWWPSITASAFLRSRC
jgi:hypothetical protein